MNRSEVIIAALPCWQGDVDIAPISGGITNQNFKVTDQGRAYFVRLGEDIPIHGVMRFNELNASRAASRAGISPDVIFHQDGVLVLRFIDGETLTEASFEDDKVVEKSVELVKRCHYELPKYLEGPALTFWVFQVVAQYVNTLQAGNSRMIPQLPELQKIAQNLSDGVGEIRLTFGHNDLLPANFISDGHRLWLIDWDYAGFNSALFDLGGLSSNNSFTEAQEKMMLELFYTEQTSRGLWKKYQAMKCASLLRESMWSMVSELYSDIKFDFEAYTQENLDRFTRSYEQYRTEFGDPVNNSV